MLKDVPNKFAMHLDNYMKETYLEEIGFKKVTKYIF